MGTVNINRVVLTGNLTADPDLRALPSGTSVCELRVAVNTRRKDGQSGEWVDKANYFDVVVFGGQADNAAKYLAKGRAVAIDGRLDYQEWEKDGQRRSRVKVLADTLQYLSSPDHQGGQSAPPAGVSDFAPAPQQQALPTADDDIPF